MSWQKNLAQGFSSAKDLLTFLELPVSLASHDAEQQFRTRVPVSFAARMKKGDANDPLLLQVLATKNEMQQQAQYVADPLQESSKNPLQGLLHKYPGRVLLTLTGSCAVNCRFCFRRHFPYQENNPGRAGWAAVMDYIRKDSSIHEVILSGGDPLLASDVVLNDLITQLNAIEHLRILRFHTRVPVVLPERIDSDFLKVLNHCRLQKVMVLHCNHAQELNHEVALACKQLAAANVYLLNQSVLLKGINDSVEALVALSEDLFQHGVLPYYLHLMDKVDGAAHFDAGDAVSLELYRALQQAVPGYLLPRLAREEAGAKSKTLYV